MSMGKNLPFLFYFFKRRQKVSLPGDEAVAEMEESFHLDPSEIVRRIKEWGSLNSGKEEHRVLPGRRSYELRRLPSTHSSMVSRTVLALYHA
jgi:hypothetical protein